MARKPSWDGRRMGWKQDGLDWGAILPSVSAWSTWWMDMAECWDMVGQRKLFSVMTGNRNIAKLVLDWARTNMASLQFATRW